MTLILVPFEHFQYACLDKMIHCCPWRHRDVVNEHGGITSSKLPHVDHILLAAAEPVVAIDQNHIACDRLMCSCKLGNGEHRIATM
jgi:hypothetical protein